MMCIQTSSGEPSEKKKYLPKQYYKKAPTSPPKSSVV